MKIVIIGDGKVGHKLAVQLSEEDYDIVLIDNNQGRLKDAIEWIICILIAIVIALLVRYYIGTPTVVESVSMEPTLYAGQRLWVNRWGRTTKRLPQRGEIITFEAPTRIADINKEDVDISNPVAKYENEPQGLWQKFVHNVLEIGKTSYIKRFC